MRIGIDGRLWSETGVGRCIRNLVKGLGNQDRENQYVLFVTSKNIAECRSLLMSFDSSHLAKSTQEKVLDRKSEYGNWKLVEADIPWHSLREQMELTRVLYKEQLDVMHFTYFSVPLAYTRPFVFTLHDLIPFHFSTGKASTLPSWKYQLKRVAYKQVITQAARKAKKVIVPLEAAKQDIIETLHLPEEKIIVTYEGFDSTLQSDKDVDFLFDTTVPYFMYVGNTYPHKNVAQVLEAFIELKIDRSYKNLQMVLVCKEDIFTKELKKRFHSQDIVYIHDISDGELAYLYSHAKAFVSASLMEGFGLPPLEAMALSCPVIVSDIPSFQEVCGEAAVYFDPSNRQELVEKMKEIYNLNEDRKRELIKKGLERIKLFQWEKMVKETLEVYKHVV